MRKTLIAAICILLCCACNGTPTPVQPTVVTPTLPPAPTVTLTCCDELTNLWLVTNWVQSAYLDMMPTLVAVQTRIAELEPTLCAPTPGATAPILSTPTPALTKTPTATPSPDQIPWLCRTCVKNCTVGTEGCCPSGYLCANCYAAGYRCVRETSPNADCQTCRGAVVAAAENQWIDQWWQGVATWYGADYRGLLMRNEEPYDPEAYTCAVSSSRWDELRGRILTICATSACTEVLVTDTFDAQWHRVDLSRRAFSDLAALDVGVIEVRVWLSQ